MRIIAGIAKGMVLAVPKGAELRPTSDRVREAIFSSLGERVVDADVLDLYAGTGALGLEAGSRGARSVTFVEMVRQSLDSIERNLASFRKNKGVACEFEVLRGDVFAHLKRLGRQFQLIFADPPYALDPAPLLAEVRSRRLLVPDGLFVLETSKRAALDAGLLWELTREAVYGDTRVCHFRATNVGGH
jgi:16S rRNA (guanine(966)-N(2))-methyltransferase RsmD